MNGKERTEIRVLDRKDLRSLLELYAQLDEGNLALSPEESEKLWENEIEGNRHIRYFGAVENGRVVSTCYAVIIPNLTRGNRPICFIENVVTDRAHRNRGLAAAVMKQAILFARENNCYKAILQSGNARTDAHRFYEGIGFRGDTKKAFDMRLEDSGE